MSVKNALTIFLVFLLGFNNLIAQSACDEDDDTECLKPGGCDPSPQDSFQIPRLHAVDPNDITGPLGYDTAQWMSVNDQFGYQIRFENDPEFATAPAQIVRINCPIDEHMNLASVRLGDFGFGSFNFQVPPNTSFYTDRLDVRDSLNVFVNVTAGIDVTKNEAFWIFESIDPATGLAPLDALTGFLPVNDTTTTIYTDTIVQKGEGYVNFTVYPKTSSMTGDTVKEQASIIFDDNAPIETNIWVNLIDAFGPVTTMDTVPDNVPVDTITLCWSAVDDPGGVGVATYNLYVSENGEQYYLFSERLDTTCFLFEGDLGSTYSFYVRSVDNVGNEEELPEGPRIVVSLGGEISLAIKVLLEGPYSETTGLMGNTLQQQGLVPLTEPYGTVNRETTTQAVLDNDAVPENTIVDWVLIELRDTETTVAASRAALVQRDGDVVDLDGVSPVTFKDVEPGSYYVVVKHRNHLGTMSREKITVGFAGGN